MERFIASARIMSDLLYQWLCREDNRLLSAIMTPGSSEFKFDKSIRAVCFSGGVADCIYHPSEGAWARYGDMGVVLGEAIRASRLFSDFRVIEAKETIRATVVGAEVIRLPCRGVRSHITGMFFR